MDSTWESWGGSAAVLVADLQWLRLLLSLAMLATEAACFSTRLASIAETCASRSLTMKKSKRTPRLAAEAQLPFRVSRVALQLVSRGASAVRAEVPIAVTNVAAQTLVCDGLLSEFASDSIIAQPLHHRRG